MPPRVSHCLRPARLPAATEVMDNGHRNPTRGAVKHRRTARHLLLSELSRFRPAAEHKLNKKVQSPIGRRAIRRSPNTKSSRGRAAWRDRLSPGQLRRQLGRGERVGKAADEAQRREVVAGADFMDMALQLVER